MKGQGLNDKGQGVISRKGFSLGFRVEIVRKGADFALIRQGQKYGIFVYFALREIFFSFFFVKLACLFPISQLMKVSSPARFPAKK